MNDDIFGSASDGSVSSGQDTSDLQEDVSKEKTTQLNVEIPERLHQRLKMHAAKHGQTIKDVVSEAIDSNIDT